jgi:HSP20 family protein
MERIMARNIVRFNPLAELDALRKQAFGDDFFTSFQGVALPTTDVYTEGDNQLVVEAHLPNFDEGDVNVNVDEGALIVQAEKRQREEDTKKKYMVRESSTSFYRRIALPDRADEDNIQANFSNGVLKVVVPFKELPSPKKIAINAGQSSSTGDASASTDAQSGQSSGQSSESEAPTEPS